MIVDSAKPEAGPGLRDIHQAELRVSVKWYEIMFMLVGTQLQYPVNGNTRAWGDFYEISCKNMPGAISKKIGFLSRI